MQSHCQRQVLPLASNRASVSPFTQCGILGEMLTLWSPPLPLSDSMSLQNISSLARTVTLPGHSSAPGKCSLKKQNHFKSSFITKYCTSATVPKREESLLYDDSKSRTNGWFSVWSTLAQHSLSWLYAEYSDPRADTHFAVGLQLVMAITATSYPSSASPNLTVLILPLACVTVGQSHPTGSPFSNNVLTVFWTLRILYWQWQTSQLSGHKCKVKEAAKLKHR